MGVDAQQVGVKGPDADGLVTVKIPDAKVLGTPYVDESTFSELYADTGVFTTITLNDQRDAYEVAQGEMRKKAENDDALLKSARDRASALIEQYIKTVGKALGQTYVVEFE